MMKTLKESILSSTGTGRYAYKKQIENCEFTPELVKMLENKVAYYKPRNSEELRKLIEKYIKFAGNSCDLNWIDTSEITNMNNLFSPLSSIITCKFNGNISEWDVSNVMSMSYMFCNNKKFNGNISKWNVSNVIDMSFMFYGDTNFNQDISKWDVKKVRTYHDMFTACPIKPEYKPNRFR